MKRMSRALGVGTLLVALAGCAETMAPAGGFQVLAGTRGSPREIMALGAVDPATTPTYTVGSVHEEYLILDRMGRTPGTQALVMDARGHPYDIIDTPQGPVLFDIASFYGHEI